MSTLWTLTLFTERGNVRLSFRGQKTAEEAWNAIEGYEGREGPTVSDDFGNRFKFRATHIAGMLLTEVGQDMDWQREYALAQARMQVKTQKDAQTDSVIGPSIPRQGIVVPGLSGRG